jgi:hypothetical protein
MAVFTFFRRKKQKPNLKKKTILRIGSCQKIKHGYVTCGDCCDLLWLRCDFVRQPLNATKCSVLVVVFSSNPNKSALSSFISVGDTCTITQWSPLCHHAFVFRQRNKNGGGKYMYGKGMCTQSHI